MSEIGAKYRDGSYISGAILGMRRNIVFIENEILREIFEDYMATVTLPYTELSTQRQAEIRSAVSMRFRDTLRDGIQRSPSRVFVEAVASDFEVLSKNYFSEENEKTE